MAEVIIAGWFVSVAVTKVVDIIKFYINNQIEYQKGKQFKLRQLERHLRKIEVAIYEVGKRRITNPSLQAWLWDVQDAACSVHDVIDIFHYKLLEERAKSKNKVDGISILVKVAEFHVATNKQHEVAIPDWRRTTTTPPAKSYSARGREHDMESLLNMLGDEPGDAKYSVVAIVGPGGIGKTHLARLAYNIVKEREEKKFDVMAWVCACNDFDVKRLSVEMIESAGFDRPSDLHSISNLEEIQNIIRKRLTGKRFFIVLDDVWEESNTIWENLCLPFTSGEKGSKIVVTTTNQNVAKMMRTQGTLHLDGKIAKKLGGSPLAAVTVGRVLESKLEEEHWRRILRKRICEVKQTESDIAPVLRLSYEDLPAHLKQCYLSCSLFPRKHCFEKDELLRIWMALGFFARGDDWNNRMEDVGEESIEELSCRSFFVNAKRRQNKFELHPILHEFAESVSDGEYFRLEGIKSGEPIRIPNKARHVYVAADDLVTVAETLCERKEIRSLVVVGGLSCTSEDNRSRYNKSLKEVLESLKSLRLLVLSVLGGSLPEAIGELKHLRYLELPGNAIPEWPRSFCKLYHLAFHESFAARRHEQAKQPTLCRCR
ncbi:hypothetical protein B296_00005776 [Ensete ventricosum]|uniref:AAA+ ATPase domain-containing protein n=1 Tax=Ensete ventricosum TaxID=4639 RepID=A0A427APL9_ENSVE|nr:hypothetical protein B296_00005776 [Ensete ventricosum]